MRFNENIAISTSKVLLVPYDAHHVLRYHEWMRDPAIQEATASEPLTLDEEYENQQSWRTSHDKLTFIVCRAMGSRNGDPEDRNSLGEVADQGSDPGNAESSGRVYAGEVDLPSRMVGDINLFFTPWEEDGYGGGEPSVDVTYCNGAMNGTSKPKPDDPGVSYCNGEVDIMIADRDLRGKGLGISAVSTLLHFIRRHLKPILAEYGEAQRDQKEEAGAPSRLYELKDLVAKISTANSGSIALFTKLGFKQRGEVNYFGEVELVLEDFGRIAISGEKPEFADNGNVADYREMVYDRSRLQA